MAVLYLSENGKGWSLLSFHLLVRWVLLYLMVESPLSGISNSLLDIVRRVFKFFCNSIVVLLSSAYCNLINWSTEVLQHVLLYLQSVFININKILSSEFIVLSQPFVRAMDDNNDKIAVVLWNSLMWNNCSSRYYWVIVKIVPDWKRRGKEGIWSLAKGVLIHASCNLVNSILSKTNQVM